MNADAAQWELWEFDEKTEEMEQRDAADHGNLTTRLVHAPNEAAARERFAEAAARVMALVPEAMRAVVEQRIQQRRGDGVSAAWAGVCAGADGLRGAELQPRAGDYVWRGGE